DDYGRHWTPIIHGLPADVFTRVIREDPVRRGLLYAGTETGVRVSVDDGLNWQSLRYNLPVVPIHDLCVKDDDLIAATHGRAFWVLDDVTPLRQLADIPREGAAVHLFTPRTTLKFAGGGGFGLSPVPGTNYAHVGVGYVAYRELAPSGGGEKQRVYLDGGQNPPDGVAITYLLGAKPEGEVTLTLLDAQGQEIKRFSSEERKTPRGRSGDLKTITGEVVSTRDEPRVAVEPGFNRFRWDMRYADAAWVDGFVSDSGIVSGPVAPPGRYQARLSVGDQSQTVWFEIASDPRIGATPEDLAAQFALLCQIRDKLSAVHQAINGLRAVREQVDAWEARARRAKAAQHEEITRQAGALKEHLGAIEEELIETRSAEDDDTLRFPVKLNVKLASLMSVVASADAAPTRQAREVFAALSARADALLARLRELTDRDLGAFNALLRATELPAVDVSTELKEEQQHATKE
ncbi:MAG TPA: hypothetical protein VGN32_17920, partial [Ktedonobacterales bacterium]|nr:hypothetical protein [Ktedonobacterales bacterium]